MHQKLILVVDGMKTIIYKKQNFKFDGMERFSFFLNTTE